MSIFDFFIPKGTKHSLIRLGGDGDGAYILPNDLEEIDACFSPGVNNFKVFEDQLSTEHGIKAHMCDYSSDADKLMTPLIPGLQTFEKLWLDINGEPNSITLDDWVNNHSADDGTDLMLQIDIEGAEYRNLLHCSDKLLSRFRIIIMELHGLSYPKDSDFFLNNVQPLCERLSKTHLAVHAHANNCCGQYIDQETGMNIPSALELTLLRHDRAGDAIVLPILPHPLDISQNVRCNPPMHLNEQWLKGLPPQNLNALKILQDFNNYLEYKHTEDDITESILKLYDDSAVSTQALLEQRERTFTHLEVAEGKRYQLSSSYGGYDDKGAVVEKEPFFFHTGMAKDQKITIDLEQVFNIERIEIRNRLDGWQYRANCLFIDIASNEDHDNHFLLPVPHDSDFLAGRKERCFITIGGVAGRYVSIVSPLHTALHFSHIKIFTNSKTALSATPLE